LVGEAQPFLKKVKPKGKTSASPRARELCCIFGEIVIFIIIVYNIIHYYIIMPEFIFTSNNTANSSNHVYATSINQGSKSYGDIHTRITGPLTTHNTPGCMEYHSHGILFGKSTPPQFHSMQSPPSVESTVHARQYYNRTTVTYEEHQRLLAIALSSTPLTKTIKSSGRRVAVSSHANYVEPMSCSMRTNIVSKNAVGQSVNTCNSHHAISTKNFDQNVVKRATRRCRSGGCTVPKKVTTKGMY
jgi:hypothetical protein